MTFFQWIPENSGKIVSPLLWIYFLVTVGLTLFTVCVWHFFVNRKKHAKFHQGDVESSVESSRMGSIRAIWEKSKARRQSEKLA